MDQLENHSNADGALVGAVRIAASSSKFFETSRSVLA